MSDSAPPTAATQPAPAPSVGHERGHRTWKAWLVFAIGVLVIAGGIVGIKVTQIRTMIGSAKGMVPPPEAVTSAEVKEVNWEIATPAVGSLIAVHAGVLGSELGGRIRQIGFDSGSNVKEGAVLVRLDTSVEEAQLTGALADQILAKRDLERARSLRQAQTNTPQDLETAEARARDTEALVSNLQAVIAKKTIRAPFDGRMGIRQVELGQPIGPSTTVASLQSVTPIYGEFWLPQQALGGLSVGQQARLRTDAFPNRSWEGQVSTIDTEVDATTRNVRIRATFVNEDGALRPGMYANFDVLSAVTKPTLIVPATAVVFAPYGDSVFVIAPDGESGRLVARQRFVRLGERRGDFVGVASGLAKGERIVSTGAFKLHGDTSVVVNNALAPDASVSPTPANE